MKDAASLVRAGILALQGYHTPPAGGMVKLDAMENPYRLPGELAVELGVRLGKVAINRYPDASQADLKQVLRKAYDVPAGAELVLGNGSDELLQLISLAVAREGARALSVEPTFAMFRISAITAGLAWTSASLKDDFSLDEGALIRAINLNRPALTWLSYPNNPTGNLFPRESILRAIDVSPGLVVVDEAYNAFAGGASLLGEVGRHPNLIVLRTLSKLGLAGLRLGVAVAPPDWAAQLEKLRLPYNVNVLSAEAAAFVLSHCEVLDAQTSAIVADRARLESSLDRLPVVRRFPSAANFVLARVPGAPAVFEGLRSRGILVRNLHGAHPLLHDCLRFTIGTPEENARLVAALTEILA